MSGAVMTLRLVAVTKRYGAQIALDRVSLDVRAGEIYGFIGHNGSGKTTAMRIALGLVRPDTGSVFVDGFDAAKYPREARARMGGLIETPGFHGAWSGTKNLEELARLQGLARKGARHEAALWFDRVGLARAGSKPVAAYSHGMRQRLGIAQAVLGSPPIVLLDEPTNGLDPEGIVEMRELLIELNQDRGTTILLSSHQLHELGSLCQRIGVLKGGQVVAEADTRELFAAHGRHRLDTQDMESARRVLAAQQVVVDAGSSGLTLDIGSRTPDAIVTALVAGGVRIQAFAPEPQSLEQIYLRFPSESAVAAEQPEAVRGAAPREQRAPNAPSRRVLLADIRRWGSSWAVPCLLVAPALSGSLAIVRRAAQAAQDSRAVGQSQVISATDVNGFEAVGIALQAGLPVLAFVALGLGSQAIAAELGRGTLRNTLLRPVTRVGLALGKLGALALSTLLSYALLAVTATTLAAIAFGFGDVTEVLPNGARFTLVPAAALQPELVRALLSPLVPLCAYVALGFLAGTVARVGAAALALALATGVLLDVGRGVLRAFDWRSASPSDHLPSPLSDTSLVRYFVDVSQGISNATFDHGSTSVWVPALWALGACSLATAIVQRRDVP